MKKSSISGKYWSRRLDSRLVKIVERRRCVWDPSHPHYTSSAHRQQVYEEFASKYGAHFPAESVKERWFNIRSTFGCCLRKVEASCLNNSTKPYEPSWHLWNACQFLMKVKKSDEPSTSADLTDDQVKTESTSDIEDDPTTLLLKADEEAIIGDANKSNDINDESLNCGNVVKGIVSAFNGVQNSLFGQQNQEYAKIGRLVTRKLSKMTSYEAAVTSQKIMEILLLYEEDNPENPNNAADAKNLTGESL